MKCTYVLCAEEEIGFNVGIDGEALIYLNFIHTHFRVALLIQGRSTWLLCLKNKCKYFLMSVVKR